ncbi:hypothetical protein N0V85_008622 [Neurospora sp. IMI 360204]|nr:hypothetical protein N0V85_008622 [Neurospora sp. IMI 360204]
MSPTAGFPTLPDSLAARVDLIPEWPENTDQASSPASAGHSTRTQSEDGIVSQGANDEVYQTIEVGDSDPAASSLVNDTNLSQASPSESTRNSSNSASPNTEDATDDGPRQPG